MGLNCLVYPGLCQKPFDILNKCNFKYVRCHRGATVSFFPTQVVTNYIAVTSNQASPGFRILLETVIGQVYQLKTTAKLTLGDKAFVYVETPDGTRLVPRTNLFVTGGGSTSYVIDFTATEQLTFVGILFQNFDVSYSLTTTEFLVSCLDPIDCNQVIDCLCQIEHCPDTYTYEICVDFLQVHLDLLNSPASFPVGTVLSIQGYRIAEGSVDIGATGLPALIGIVPITFNQMRSAFEALTWQTIGLGLIGEFRATLKDQVLIISHVLVDNDLNIGPPFSINLPTNCTQLDECATNNPANRLLIKKPDNSLCWANICPPLIDTCLTKCSLEDHVGILPDESLSSNASLSVGPRGSGFLCAQKPLPGSTGGGDCRGSYAVDWQMFRDTSDDVAGADFSVIGGGSSNHIQDGEVTLHQFGTTGAEGSVIAGGQSNEIHISVFEDGDFPFYSFIGATAGTNLSFSTISGGFSNQIKVEAEDQSSFFCGQATIAGGAHNFIHTLSLPSNVVPAGGVFSFYSRNSGSTIGGGGGNLIETQGNLMRTDLSVIAGGGGGGATGTGNIIRAVGETLDLNHYSVISGGESNRIEALGNYNDVSHSVVGGGGRNLIQAIGNGTNIASYCFSSFAVIDGGLYNRIGADGLDSTSQFSVIGGGYFNKIVAKNANADASSAVITGGSNNKIYAYSSVKYSAIGGGQGNIIQSKDTNDCNHSVIAGGHNNLIFRSGKASVISGGFQNRIAVNGGGTSKYNAIGGGNNNRIYTSGAIQSNCCVIAGGRDNKITDFAGPSVGINYSTVSGGRNNLIQTPYGTIGGGRDNKITGTTLSHSHNSIIGGFSNIIDGGKASTILGGYDNEITGGSYSVVGGKGASSKHDNCFVFGNGSGSTGPNQVVFNAIPNTPITGGKNVVVKPNGTLGVGSTFKLFQEEFEGLAVWTILDGSNNYVTEGPVAFHGMYTCLGFQVDVCLTFDVVLYPLGGTDYNILYNIPLISANLPPDDGGGINIQITVIERPNAGAPARGMLKNMFINNTITIGFPNSFSFRLSCVDLSPAVDAERSIAPHIRLCYNNGDPPADGGSA